MPATRGLDLARAAGLTCDRRGPRRVSAQTISQRGFVEGSGVFFPQEAPNDPTRDRRRSSSARDERVRQAGAVAAVGRRPRRARELARSGRRLAGASTSRDRGVRRPRLSVRRLSATVHARTARRSIVGKQFIRWGKTDIVTPTDRFAPRDFLNVVDNDFLAVTGARAVDSARDRRRSRRVGAALHAEPRAAARPALDRRARRRRRTSRSSTRARRSRRDRRSASAGATSATGFEYSLSFFDGFNHLPNIDVARPDPVPARHRRRARATRRSGRTAPTRRCRRRWFTIKGEAAYFTSPSTERPTSTCSTSCSSSGRPASG